MARAAADSSGADTQSPRSGRRSDKALVSALPPTRNGTAEVPRWRGSPKCLPERPMNVSFKHSTVETGRQDLMSFLLPFFPTFPTDSREVRNCSQRLGRNGRRTQSQAHPLPRVRHLLVLSPECREGKSLKLLNELKAMAIT